MNEFQEILRLKVKNLIRKYLQWKYRYCDPEVCCCGCMIGTGGEICYHGGCRSMQEYVITLKIEEIFGKDDYFHVYVQY